MRSVGVLALDPDRPPPPVERAASTPVGWEVPSTPHEHVQPPHLTEEEDLETAANVVMAVCAVLTIVGAGFSWWHANASKKARDAAEKADANATRQREAIEKIAEALNPAPEEHAFSIEWQNEICFVLRNIGTAPVTVNAITNDTEGLFDVPYPFTLNPGCGQRIYEAPVLSSGHVDELVLDIADSDTPLTVPLPRM